MDITDSYFSLSDPAVTDENVLLELCSLFSDDAVIKPNNMPEIKGKDNIISFFKTFFGRNEETKHLWTTVISENKLKQVNWGVVCKKNGELFTLTGTDYFKIENNKIVYLEVVGNG